MNSHPDPNLPQGIPKRWTAQRKAAIILAIRKGSISAQEACAHYDLSPEELAEWERDLDRYGVPGLRTTRVQIYRKTSEPK
jgi:transposase-like protein